MPRLPRIVISFLCCLVFLLVSLPETLCRSTRTPGYATYTACPPVSSKQLLPFLSQLELLLLQRFSPLRLCADGSMDAALMKVTGQPKPQSRGSAWPVRSLPVPSSSSVNLIPGCTAVDLQQSLAILPAPTAKCSWSIVCDYVASRFPQLLYKAELSQSATMHWLCQSCQPVYRLVPVLRQRLSTNPLLCPTWDRFRSLERIIIGYSCP
eukprot:scpid88224/ scgid35041/ 